MKKSIHNPASLINAAGSAHGKTVTPAGLFRMYADVGFHIIPIIPSDATINPTSTVSDANRGKVPGAYQGDNIWGGYNGWQNVVASSREIELWDTWDGAGIGIICGDIIGLDIEMTLEPNDGEYGGHHGRYRLLNRVRLLDVRKAA